MDREAWYAPVHGVTKGQTWLSEWTELNWSQHTGVPKFSQKSLNILVFKNSLRYNSHTIKFTTVHNSVGFLKYIHKVMQPLKLSNFRTFLPPQKETSYPLAVAPYPPGSSSPWQPLIYFLFLMICLFWTFYVSGIVQYVAFGIWLFFFFTSIRVFSNESALHIRWPKYFSIPSNENSGPISFRMDWLDLLAVQGTLKSLLQHHSSKASIAKIYHR